MLALVRKAVVLAMLVITSSGAAPLWLHHLTSHCQSDHCQSDQCSGSECDETQGLAGGADSCCELEANPAARPIDTVYSIESVWSSPDHACSLCYQLSQQALSADLHRQLQVDDLVFFQLLHVAQRSQSVPVGLQPSRGPPAA